MFQTTSQDVWVFTRRQFDSVKVFYPNKQVRRIAFPTKGNVSYKDIKSKIESYIKDESVDKTKLQISYLDNDGDWIRFDSKLEFQELQEATIRHSTLKLKVEFPNQSNTVENKKPTLVTEQTFFPPQQPFQIPQQQQPSFQQPVPFSGMSYPSEFGFGAPTQEQLKLFQLQQQNQFNFGNNQQPQIPFQPTTQQPQNQFTFGITSPQQTQPNFGTPTQQPNPSQPKITTPQTTNPLPPILNFGTTTSTQQPQIVSSGTTTQPVKSVEPEPFVHNGFACDSCFQINNSTNAIVGARFHCLVCDNFDACENCFQNISSCHPQHHKYEKILNPDSTSEIIDLTPKVDLSTNPNQSSDIITIEDEPEIPREPEVSEEEKVFEQQLILLGEMGFNEKEKNIEILKKHGGNFTNAVQDLLTSL
jgi:hypothetical protein